MSLKAEIDELLEDVRMLREQNIRLLKEAADLKRDIEIYKADLDAIIRQNGEG